MVSLPIAEETTTKITVELNNHIEKHRDLILYSEEILKLLSDQQPELHQALTVQAKKADDYRSYLDGSTFKLDAITTQFPDINRRLGFITFANLISYGFNGQLVQLEIKRLTRQKKTFDLSLINSQPVNPSESEAEFIEDLLVRSKGFHNLVSALTRSLDKQSTVSFIKGLKDVRNAYIGKMRTEPFYRRHLITPEDALKQWLQSQT